MSSQDDANPVSPPPTVVSFGDQTLDRMVKLTSFRRKDQVHVLDLIEVGLVDASWLSRFPEELAERLRELLENPEG